MMALDTMEDLLLDELRDLYDAELQIIKALPRLAKRAHTPSLRNALREQLEETETHVERLENVFDQLGVRGTGRKSRAIQGLLDEGMDLVNVEGADSVRDAALIVSVQRVAHYEIAMYGTVVTHAFMLGHAHVARVLEQSLDAQKRADVRLTRIAEEQVNRMAAEVGRYDNTREPLGRPLDDRKDDRIDDDTR